MTKNKKEPKPPSVIAWAEMLRTEFSKESDRASVIIAATMIENALEILLKSFLVPTDSADDSLFAGAYAPLSSFSAKIDMAYRVGLISSRFCRDLHLVRKIRNDFAHNVMSCSFEDAPMRSRVLELSRSSDIAQRNPHIRARFDSGPRGDFLFSVEWMHWRLRSLAEHVKSLNPSDLEWGYSWTDPSKKGVNAAYLIDMLCRTTYCTRPHGRRQIKSGVANES